MNAIVEIETELRDSLEPIPDALDAFWPSRIQEDRTQYGQYVNEGETFYASNEHSDNPAAVYRITDIRHNGDVFTLEPTAQTTALDKGFDQHVHDAFFISNICELAGAIDYGELIHLPDGVLKTIGDTTFFSVGDVTIELPESTPDADSTLRALDPPGGPINADIAKVIPALDSLPLDPVLHAPQRVVAHHGTQQTVRSEHATANDVRTSFRTVQRFSKWTFEDDVMRDWVESQFEPGDRILNACAGKTRLTPPPGGEIVRNDVNPDRDADVHVDVAELATKFEKGSFDMIIFDPPWSVYQSNLRYEGHHVTKGGEMSTTIDLTELPFKTPSPDEKTQLGHARLAKENFDWLLKPNGILVQITFHGTCMPARLEYDRCERVIFDPIGEGKSVIGSLDQKTGRVPNGTNLVERTPGEPLEKNAQQTLVDF